MKAVCRSLTWMLAVVSLVGSGMVAPSWSQERVQGKNETVLLAAEPASGELKPVAVAAFAPYETLVSDIGFLGSLAGKPELGQMVEGGFAFFTQGKGPEALDKTKPWGVITQTDGNTFLPVICLPVKNFDDIVGIATAFGAKLADGEEEVKVLTLQSGQTLYLKNESGWAFAAQSPAALERVPADPAASFGKLLDEYDVAVKVAVKNVPDAYRQLALQAMKAGMEQQLAESEGATEEDSAARREAAEAQMQQMVQVIDDIDSLFVGWSIDAQQQRTFADFTYLVKPGTKSDRQLAAYKDVTTNFAGFFQPDAAVTTSFSMNADPELLAQDAEQMNAAMLQMRAQFNQAVDENSKIEDEEVREIVKTAVGDLFDALEATIKGGRFDAAGSLKVATDSMTLVAGAHVKEPQKIEDGLKKIEEAAKKRQEGEKELPSVQWNADEYKGIAFHTITVPVPEHLNSPRKLLGENADVAVGIGAEAVYLAVGRDNMVAVQQAIDASAAEPNKSVPPFEFAISVTPILEVAASETPEAGQRKILESVAQMLRTESQGRDHIRLLGSLVPNGLRYRLEVEEGVLRGIGKATAEAQRQMLEAQQQPQ